MDARDVISFPAGDNDTDTIFGSTHFNLTTLVHFNYTVYSNGTLSNNSKCYLTYEPYVPALLFPNGTFVNGTGCYNGINPIGDRGRTGIGMAAAFGVCLVLLLTCLAKHGPQHLPREKRFAPLGRRWQWYWGLFVCSCALVSLFLNIDVDRYKVQQLPIIVTTFFYYLMCMGSMALVWEAVRHWGSWMERQYIDPNPFVLRDDDRRSKIEFWLPLWCYLLIWMNFFMIIPRSWKFAQMQRSPEQEAAIAEPGATGIRFKIAAFFLFGAWLTTVFSMSHSINHYKPRKSGLFNRLIGLFRDIPLRFALLLPLSLGMIAYQALIAFQYRFSVMRADGPIPIIYGWGYGTQLAILVVQILYGWSSPNEDKELMRQRRVRGEMLDRELGIIHRPAWWRRVKGEHLVGTVRDKLARNVNEVGQGRSLGRRAESDMERDIRQNMERNAAYIELDSYDETSRYQGNSKGHNPRVDRAGVRGMGTRTSSISASNLDPESERVVNIASSLLFPDPEEVERREREAEEERRRRLEYITSDGPPPAYEDDSRGRSASSRSGDRATGERSNSTGTTNSINAPATQIRSMLDI
ncbi:Protein of unknown function (DUF2434) [Geosmithia morbida]|uniref:Uncharacterized protein n=1 Tax=Geosmithia morbida TaxID=1094350 RepID=A0A9P5CZI8_9HYPO|nr:Protein of unknown function (DUF2434) [Geosmithia morbida]KAF4121623.1 Protein of unknown function (DUF2434) [Geosmithia morbida]